LTADESKKSVLWLKDLPTTTSSSGDPNAATKNIKTLMLVAADDTKNAFYIGGFQLQGLAKIIKVYVDDADRMIMSVRGIKSTRLQAFFKAQCVIPGGARPVADFVRLELEPAAAIHQVRWTIRMRDSDNDTSTNGDRPQQDGHAAEQQQQHRTNCDAASMLPVSTDEASNSSMGLENGSFSHNGGGGGSFSNHMNGDVSERGEDTGIMPMPEPPPPSMLNLHSASAPATPSALLQAATTLVESTTMSSSLLLGGSTAVAATTVPRNSTNNNGVAMSNGTGPGSSSTGAAAGSETSIAAVLAHHMADLTSAMRELTTTIKEHQRFLQEQQRPPDRS
jgi:hypothetical protein